MLRAALIGFPSSGKTTLFQLMTSARETAKASHGKGETSIGISRVPDGRLDFLAQSPSVFEATIEKAVARDITWKL